MKKLNYKVLANGELAAGLLAILSLAFFRADIAMMVIYGLVLIYILITKQKHQLKNFAIASVIALIWLLVGGSQYGYNTNYIVIWGMNSFPLFAWACGLFGTQLLYNRYRIYLPTKNLTQDFVIFVLIYCIAIVVIETIGYHVFNIHDLVTAQYSGLPICDCLHAPYWMKIAYFTMGPINYLVTSLIIPSNRS